MYLNLWKLTIPSPFETGKGIEDKFLVLPTQQMYRPGVAVVATLARCERGQVLAISGYNPNNDRVNDGGRPIEDSQELIFSSCCSSAG